MQTTAEEAKAIMGGGENCGIIDWPYETETAQP